MRTQQSAAQHERIRAARRQHAEQAVDLTAWRRWYDGEGEGAGAQTTTPDTPSDSGAGNGAAGGNGGQSDTPAWLPDRLKRAEEKAAKDERERLLKELGIEDAEADRQLLADARKRKADEMTAVEKAAKEKEAAEKRANELAADLERERAAYRLEKRDNAIRDALRGAGVTDDKDNPRVARVLTLLKAERAADVEALQGDDGAVDEKKLEKLVTDARTAYPDFFKAARFVPGTGSHANVGRVADPAKADKARAKQETAQRQQSGW